MLNLFAFFTVLFAPAPSTPPPPAPAAVVAPAPAPAPADQEVAPPVIPPAPAAPTTTTTTTTVPVPGYQTFTATDCTVTWMSTQTNPVNGQVGTYPTTFYGSCSQAAALGAEFGVPVTQTAPFTYGQGTGEDG